jgi:glycosyltransferase involved in cell wall biosynthesis
LDEDADGLIKVFRTYTYAALHKSFIHRVFSFLSFTCSSFIKSFSIRNVDIVWGTTPPIFQAASAWLIARLKRAPFLLEVRDLWPEFAIAVGVLRNPILIRMSYWLENFLYRHSDKITVNSPGFIRYIEKSGGKNITLIPNGADPAFFNKTNRNLIRNELSWTNKFVFLYAGAHGLSNDLEVILQTAEILKSESAIHFALIGDGKEKVNLQLAAENNGLTNLEFIEPVAKNKMADYFSAADACIAVLKPIEMYKTTYPNKVFDYMAARKPVILAIDGVIRKVVENAGCGLFCNPGDSDAMAEKCLYLFNNQEEANRMGNSGFEYLLKNFNREEIADQFLNLLKQLVKSLA